MRSATKTVLAVLAAAVFAPLPAQVIEFDSNGLHYQALSRDGVTVMFAQLPLQVREYAVIEVAVSNGSSRPIEIQAEHFRFERRDGGVLSAANAQVVVERFLRSGNRADVIQLLSTYEAGLYGFQRIQPTNGYEERRRQVMAEMTSTQLAAAAAASAMVLVPVTLRPGESTDGAVFFVSTGRPLGAGRLVVHAGGAEFEFETPEPPPAAGP
jgi:hypothetical protein